MSDRVLCAVDDLMLASKLRHAGGLAGVSLQFVRSPEALLSESHADRPALVILDLNADRLRPLDMLTTLRADPALAGIRTVGFVAHVDGARIEAARRAGADEVLARSAFFTGLAALLGSKSKT